MCNDVFDFKRTDSVGWISCELCDNWICIECVKKLKIDPREEYNCTRCIKKAGPLVTNTNINNSYAKHSKRIRT